MVILESRKSKQDRLTNSRLVPQLVQVDIGLEGRTMRTRGSQVFDILFEKKTTSASRLAKLLEKKHGTDEQRETAIVHPSACSLSALELMFQQKPGKWSPHSAHLFVELRRLSDMFVTYSVLDMLYTIQTKTDDSLVTVPRSLSRMFEIDNRMRGDEASTAEDDAKKLSWEREITRISTRIVDALELTSAISRLEAISRYLDRAIRLFFALGVIPVIITGGPYNTGEEHFNIAYNDNEAARLIDAYLRVVENHLLSAHILELDTVLNDLLLTFRDGKYTATNYMGDVYQLWTFPRFAEAPVIIPPVCNVMHIEFEYIFGMAESKKHILDRMTRTNIIVSSELSGEVTSLLKAHQQSTATAEADITGAALRIAKGERTLNALETKAKLLNTPLVTVPIETEVSDIGSNDQRIQSQLRVLEDLIHANERLENKLKRTAANSYEHDVDDTSSVLTTGPIVTIPFNQIGIGSKAEARHKRAVIQSMQEDELAQRLKKTIAKLSTKSREVELLRGEAAQMLANNERLELHVSALKTNETLLKQEAKGAVKRAEELKRVNDKLSEAVRQMRTVVNTVSSEMELSENDRNRLMHLFTEHRFTAGTAVPMETGDERERYIENMIWEAMSVLGLTGNMKGTRNDACNALKLQNEFNAIAYERILNLSNARPIPIFPDINSEECLRRVNSFLPEWAKDRVVRDKLSVSETASRHTEKEHSEKVSFLKRPIVETNEIYMIDVNPRSDNDIEHTKRALISTNIINSEHGALLAENIYRYNYLNMQFRAKGDVSAIIDCPLKQVWEQLSKSLLVMNEQSFTTTGQKLAPRVGTYSIKYYIEPFIGQFAGTRGHSYRLPDIVCDFERKFGQSSLEAGELKEAGRPSTNADNEQSFTPYINRYTRLIDYFTREQFNKAAA